MTKNEMEKVVNELQELKRMRDELNDEISTLESKIKDSMKEENLDEVIAGPFKVTYKTVNGTKFDTSKFDKDHPGLREKYTRPNPYKSLRIF